MKPTRTLLRNVTLSYPVLKEPRSSSFNENATPKYSANIILDANDTENIKELRRILKEALKEKFPDVNLLPLVLRKSNLDTFVSQNGKDGWPLRDGAFVDKPGYGDGTLFFKASNKTQPFFLDENKESTVPDVFYAGCKVDVAIEAYAWNNNSSGAKGVSISLHGFRFVGDGEAFGAAPVKATDYFEDAVTTPAGSEDYAF